MNKKLNAVKNYEGSTETAPLQIEEPYFVIVSAFLMPGFVKFLSENNI